MHHGCPTFDSVAALMLSEMGQSVWVAGLVPFLDNNIFPPRQWGV